MALKINTVSPSKKREKHDNCIIVVFGQKGTGKSTFLEACLDDTRKPIKQIKDNRYYEEIWIVDPLMELTYLSDYAYNDDAERFHVVKSIYEVDIVHIPALIVIDEVDQFCSPQKPLPDCLDSWVQLGRHDDISIIAASRRPAEVHRTVTSQADYLILFRLTENRDREYIKKNAKVEITDEIDRQLQNLQRFQYLTI